MESISYYSLTTRCFTLRCNHLEWLENTQLFYNQILLFYYNLFLDLVEKEEYQNTSGEGMEEDGQRALSVLNSQQLLRELEKKTVMGRNKEPVSYPLPWSRVPLYFRRAAANAGIAAGRSFLNRKDQKPRTESFHESVTYYKGNYKDFDGKQITLKVWTGDVWTWLRCRLSGNNLVPANDQVMGTPAIDCCPGNAWAMGTQTDGRCSGNTRVGGIESADCQFSGPEIDFLSPRVVLKTKGIFLHVPVREKVANVSNAKTRMAEGTNICCVQFTNGDSIAVCTALNQENNLIAARFLKGGSQYRHSCKRVLERIDKSKNSTAGQEKLKANQKYWLRLQNISISYSHQISRQIIDFASQKQCGVLILPKYDRQYTRIVMNTVGNWSPLHLNNRIRSQLSYKAWQCGILILEVDAHNTSSKCALCGAPVKKDGEGFLCANGHRGSRHINASVNLGRKCRESFTRQKDLGKQEHKLC